MTLLRPCPIDIRRFTWSPTTKTLVAEASDLKGLTPERVYDDACDVGLTVVSPGKGDKPYGQAVFVQDRIEKDAEGDTVAWHYKLAAGQSETDADMKVVIYND